MAGPANLNRWLLLGLAVVLAHVAGLETLARLRVEQELLPLMAPPMYTRLLQQSAPPAIVVPPAPEPKPRVRAAAPKPAASAPQPAEAPLPEPPEPYVAQTVPEPPAEAASAPGSETVAVVPEPAASAPEATTATAAATALDSWPTDTRVSYRLGGKFRSGDLYGDARVLWQREGGQYQVRIDIDVSPWATLLMTSHGEVRPDGLAPRAYEELRPGNRRRAAQFGDAVLALENGKSAPRPEGMQDTASQFVELAHRFASGRETLEVGRSVDVWLARPGNVDLWTYDIVERELLQTPQLGVVEAFRLKPRPIANPRGNISAEIWFAPSLQYLPVRIKVIMGSEAHVDLIVEQIEQR